VPILIKWQKCDHTQPGEMWADSKMNDFREEVTREMNNREARDGMTSAEKANHKKKGHNMTADEKWGIASLPMFSSLTIDDFSPPQLHGQMGFSNASMDLLVAWLDSRIQQVRPQEKEARLAHLNAAEAVQANIRSQKN
jgi:hypothetical protein